MNYAQLYNKEVMLQACKSYLDQGFKVVALHYPLTSTACTCGQLDCSRGKHPLTPHGVNDATSDLAKVNEWMNSFPLLNIGIVTGKESGVIGLDIDEKNKGQESLYQFEKKHGRLPDTRISVTGNGIHLLYKYPVDVEVGNSIELLPGIDIRGNGGYIVAPPSIHVSGVYYRWQNEKATIAEAPPALIQLLANTGSRIDNYTDKKRAAIMSAQANVGQNIISILSKDLDVNTVSAIKNLAILLDVVSKLKNINI